MRAAHDQLWLEEKGSPFYGICLGAEHEHGIKPMKHKLGIPEHDISVYGIDKRRISVVPENTLHFYKEGDKALLLFYRPWKEMPKTLAEAEKLNSELRISNAELGIGTAWDEDSFGIIVKGIRNQMRLTELHQAFLNKEIAIWFGGGLALGNPGLCIGIVSAIPKVHLDTMYESDRKYHLLIQESDRIGIKQKLDELNKKFHENRKGASFIDAPFGYYALTPRWKGNEKSKYKVVYWLNPIRQDEVNYGSFTVEELEQWIEGKGPIPMTEAQRKKHAY